MIRKHNLINYTDFVVAMFIKLQRMDENEAASQIFPF